MSLSKFEAKTRCLMYLTHLANETDPFKFICNQLDNVFICLRNGIQQPYNDWKLEIKDSKIENAGRGVFINGSCKAGRLLGIYSGKLFKSEEVDNLLAKLHENDLSVTNDLEQLLNGQYTYAREDGSLIDGTPNNKLNDIYRLNPLTIGYLINHPNIDMKANLLPIDIPYNFTKENIKYCPTYTDDKEFIDDTITCFLALNNINNGDELLFDYDLGNDNDESLPNWYHKVDTQIYTEMIPNDFIIPDFEIETNNDESNKK